MLDITADGVEDLGGDAAVSAGVCIPEATGGGVAAPVSSWAVASSSSTSSVSIV